MTFQYQLNQLQKNKNIYFFWFFGPKVLEIVESTFNWSSGRFNALHWGRIGELICKELSCVVVSFDTEMGE